MYTFKSKVRYSETNHLGNLTLPGLLNYFQDCSTFESEDIGLGTEVLKKRKRAWILSYWQVAVNRFPGLGEAIEVGTFATEFRGLYGNRNFYMKDAQGQTTARANSIWVFMDTEKGRPAKPGQEDILPYGLGRPLEMDYEGRKIKLPGETISFPSFSVQKWHIDSNEHVNNCCYVQMALEILPLDMQVKQLRVEYKKSAVSGDAICPRAAFEAERTVVELCREDGELYAVIEFR